MSPTRAAGCAGSSAGRFFIGHDDEAGIGHEAGERVTGVKFTSQRGERRPTHFFLPFLEATGWWAARPAFQISTSPSFGWAAPGVLRPSAA